MCGHGGERLVTVWVLNSKDEKEPAHFLADGYEPEANTLYQFHGCHWHRHACLKDRTKRQKKRYKDTYQKLIDWLIKNNGWYTMYNLVSTWECKEPILKILRLEILATLNEHPTDEQTYLSRHTPISVAVHDTLSKEPVYLVDENPKRLIKRFIEVLTEK